jgi:hypothetical protein
MKRFIVISLLAVGTAASVTAAIYFRWQVIEREAQIALIQRAAAAHRKAADRFGEPVAAESLDTTDEELLPLAEGPESDGGASASRVGGSAQR